MRSVLDREVPCSNVVDNIKSLHTCSFKIHTNKPIEFYSKGLTSKQKISRYLLTFFPENLPVAFCLPKKTNYNYVEVGFLNSRKLANDFAISIIGYFIFVNIDKILKQISGVPFLCLRML